MEIQTVRLENIPVLMISVPSAYREEGSKRGWTSEADLLDGGRTNPELLKSQIETENSATLICVNLETKTILGCVQVEIAMEKGENKCHVGLLTVSPELQANGIGKKLLYSTHDWAKKEKCVALTIVSFQSGVSSSLGTNDMAFKIQERKYHYIPTQYLVHQNKT